MTQPFWKPQPREPWHDWRTFAIGVPVLSSAWGACLFMFLAFSFTELGAIPADVRTWIVVVAAFSTAVGSAFGSIGSSVEVYTKAFEGRAVNLDWLSLILSVAATLGGFVLGFAALLAGAEWAVFVRLWGPIVLSVLVAGDAASDVIQLGGLFAAYNIRYQAWLDEKAAWDIAHGNVPAPELRPAGIDDFRRVLGRLNGQRATLTAEQLDDELAKDGLVVPSKSTGNRWRRMAHREAR